MDPIKTNLTDVILKPCKYYFPYCQILYAFLRIFMRTENEFSFNIFKSNIYKLRGMLYININMEVQPICSILKRIRKLVNAV